MEHGHDLKMKLLLLLLLKLQRSFCRCLILDLVQGLEKMQKCFVVFVVVAVVVSEVMNEQG